MFRMNVTLALCKILFLQLVQTQTTAAFCRILPTLNQDTFQMAFNLFILTLAKIYHSQKLFEERSIIADTFEWLQ
jgi:hypothetical protein